MLLEGLCDPRLQWLFPPPLANISEAGLLTVQTAGQTDYWQRTHYGFQNHNGHLLHLPEAALRGDFIMATTVTTQPRQRFDQAGLMVLLSESCWLKTSVEYRGEGRPSQLGVVVTNSGFSDWSTQDLPLSITTLALRVRREGSDYIVEACVPRDCLPPAMSAAEVPIRVGSGSVDSPASEWTQLRVCHLMEDVSPAGISKDGADNRAMGNQLAGMAELLPLGGVRAGVYACSPKPGDGMFVEFSRLQVVAGRIDGDQ